MEIILEGKPYKVVGRHPEIGDLVVLSPNTIYPEESSNPRNTLGKIVRRFASGSISVAWSNGITNGSYRLHRDLYILEDALSATYLKTQSNKFKIY